MKNYKKYLENGIIYQINLRSFTNEGTLNSARAMLPHLKDVGVDIIYLCPCFVSDYDDNVSGWSERQRASGCNNAKNPYRIIDYYNVDAEYGTNQDLKDFIKSAHQLGLRVILDLVYFHCGPNAVFLNNHPDFVKRKADGKPDTGEWNFPILDHTNPKLTDYLIKNMQEFVAEYGVDGFRCDVGDNIPLEFWRKARESIDKLNPDLMLLNEGHKTEYLEVFDIIYSWFYYNELEELLSGKNSQSAVSNIVEKIKENYANGFGEFCLFIEQHDIANNGYDNRFEKRISEDGMNACLVGMFTLPYVPFIYNGQEIADTNRHSIFGNYSQGKILTIDWQKALSESGKNRLSLVKKLSELRHSKNAFGLSAKIQFVPNENENILTFLRGDDDEKYFIAINYTNKQQKLKGEIFCDRISEILSKYAEFCVENGKLKCALSGYGYVIIKL